MPTRSTLGLLFLLLVLVPVGAAVYFGTSGLRREQAMLVEAERQAMHRRADALRDALVRELQGLYRAEAAGEATARRGPVTDRFSIDAAGRVTMADGGEVPGDIAEVALRRRDAEGQALTFHGEIATGSGRGFRVEAARIARHYLDPLSPESVVPRADERIERVELVRDDVRTRLELTTPLGLPLTLYRHLIPSTRDADRALAPPGYLLLFRMKPAQGLVERMDEAGRRTFWTLCAVAAVAAAGLLFAWRAIRAEARLAERKTEFVSAVSHELRTPLTSIRMYADMLKEGWVEDEQTARDYFGLISAESERLARLVNNVLDFSRIEKGQRSFEMRRGDPAPVVRDAAEVLLPYLRAKGFELHLDLPESLPPCTFDRDALTQILVNLIDNAVKYGALEVRIEARGGAGGFELRVLDRGKGVPAPERETIFEPFRRGSNGAAGGGSGLGLALVRRYAEAHRGTIAVGDREGGGAVFTLRLPA